MDKYRTSKTECGVTHQHRLYWRCRRGMLELDTLLQTFLRKDFDTLTQQEINAFTTLLDTPDALLLEYLMGRTVAVDPNLNHVIQKIRSTATH